MAAVLPNQAANNSMSGLARALVQAGRLSAQQAETVHRQALAEKTAYIDVLVDSGAIDARSLAIFCSETFGYPLLDFSAVNRSYLPDNVIDPKLMQKQRVIALAKRGKPLPSFKAPEGADKKAAEIAYQKDELARSIAWLRSHA